jgi:hypothetical protein
MTDQASAPAVESTPAPAQDLNPRDLGHLFAQARQAPESAETATEPDENPAPEAVTADPPKEVPGEEPKAAEPADELPPIEPPRSWTQAEKERFQSLPRETQEYLHTREQEREREFRRGQNELAEQRKAIQAERDAAEKAKQQYEAKLPALTQELESVLQNSFADIKNMDDVVRLQAEDPFRFQQWQVQQMRLQAAKAEADRVNSEKITNEQKAWINHVQSENALAMEKIPELADKDKGPALVKRVAEELLPDIGFKDSELADLAAGKSKLSIYDHRIQQLLAESLKYRDIQKAKAVVAAKPAPPVQRPGPAKPPGSAQSETIQNLSAKHERSGSTKDLGALIGALRRA